MAPLLQAVALPAVLGTGVCNIYIAVMVYFHEEGRVGIHPCVDTFGPCDVVAETSHPGMSISTSKIVDIRIKKHVINRGVEVDAAISRVRARCDPSDPGMLQISKGKGPIEPASY